MFLGKLFCQFSLLAARPDADLYLDQHLMDSKENIMGSLIKENFDID